MIKLDDFRQKGFVEQIGILSDIEKSCDVRYVDSLIVFFNNPLGDDAVDSIVHDVLRILLSENKEKCLELLEKGADKVKSFCCKVVSRFKIDEAAPLIIKLIDDIRDKQVQLDLLLALSELDHPDLPLVFRKRLNDDDPFIASLSIEVVARYKDEESLYILMNYIESGEKEGNYEVCSVPLAKSIEALKMIPNDKVMNFLTDRIHYKNPTARRLIHEVLAGFEEEVLPYLSRVFKDGTSDEQVLTSNIIGIIGKRSGADILVEVIDSRRIDDSNLLYSIYEALGRIGALKGVVVLLDALNTDDRLMLMAVVTALENIVFPGVINGIIKHVDENEEHGRLILKSVVASGAEKLFRELYNEDKIADMLISELAELNDGETVDTFIEVLGKSDKDRARRDIEFLQGLSFIGSGLNILAVDDSEAMLRFYKAVSSELGFQVHTAINGKQGIEKLETGINVDIVVTDMNMPVMDGVEFTRRLREHMLFNKLPVLLATTESDDSQINIARNAGVTDFINKPFTPDELLAKILGLR